MTVAATQGSGTNFAADKFGTATNVVSGDNVPFVAIAAGTLGALALATSANPAFVAAQIAANPSNNFTRPANTTTYASGQLVANSVTAGSVVALTWTVTRYALGAAQVRRARLKKTTTTTANATFRLHLYNQTPGTIANGDGGTLTTTGVGYMGSILLDFTGSGARTFMSDTINVIGSPDVGTDITCVPNSGSAIFGLLEARAAYVPGSGEVFTVDLEVIQF